MVKIQNTDTYEIPHRERILKQIDRCDTLFSSYDISPETIQPQLNQYDYTKSAQTGKKIALSVLCLYAESESILPEEFYNHFEKKHRHQKAFAERQFKEYNPITEKSRTITGYAYLSIDPQIQYNAILKIWFFYKELLNALYSLREFSDMKLKYDRRDTDLFDIDEEDNLFGEN